MSLKLSLRKIDESNFISCFNLKLPPEQAHFVSHPIRSLAQAYVYYNQCCPFGIYEAGVMVGYVMVIYDYDEETYNLWHLMIDAEHQRKGFGSGAVGLVLEYIKTKPFGASNTVLLSCNEDNKAALHIYEKYGFISTGEKDGDEVIMKLEIREQH